MKKTNICGVSAYLYTDKVYCYYAVGYSYRAPNGE